jgi:hypothetical protein
MPLTCGMSPTKKGKEKKQAGRACVSEKYYSPHPLVFGNLNPWIGLDGRFISVGTYRKRPQTE